MTLDQIRAHLRAYRTTSARIRTLQMESEEIRRGIAAENSPEMQAVHGMSYNGAPGGKSPESIVERVTLRPIMTEAASKWQRELERLEEQIHQAELSTRYVDIWLSGLNDKERAVVIAHEIDFKTWDEIENHSTKLLGVYYSNSGIRRIHRIAMQRICEIAK